MGLFSWIGSHWFPFLATGGIIGTFLLSGAALVLDAHVRRVANLIQLTEHHRTLWERLLADPQLARVLDPHVDLENAPPTAAEEMFVVFIILHLSNTYYAMKTGFYRQPEGLGKDIERFFAFPLPWRVWQRVKELQERAFVAFVERALSRRDAWSPD